MKEKRTRWQVIKKAILRTITFVLVLLFVLVLTAFGLVHVPSIQTKLVEQATIVLSKKLNYPIEVKGVDLSWIDTAILEDVTIKDSKTKEFIHVDKVYVDFDLGALTRGNVITIDEVLLLNPQVDLRWNKSDKRLNINDFIVSIRQLMKPKKSKKPKIKPFIVKRVNLKNGSFSYADYRMKKMDDPERFDHNYFSVSDINVIVDDFYSHIDTVEVKVHHLSGVEGKTDFHLKDMNLDFRYTKRSLEFSRINAWANNSYLNDFVKMEYDEVADLSHFVDSVEVTAHLDSTVINLNDLAVFAPALRQFDDNWIVYGDFKGKVVDFKSRNLKFFFGRESELIGSADFQGLPRFLETSMKINLKKGHIIPPDLKQYLGKASFYREARKFGKVDFDADFKGFPTSFVAHGDFQSALGHFSSDLQFNIDHETGASNYSGKLITENFHLGRFVERSTIGTVNMSGTVKGSGFRIEDADLKLDADISELNYLGYTYKNIKTTSDLRNMFFDGFLDIEDKNINMHLDGKVDLTNPIAVFDLDGELRKAQLKALNIFERPVEVATTFALDFKGLDPDNLVGKVRLEKTTIKGRQDTLKLRNFLLSSDKYANDERDFIVKSSLASVFAHGNFTFRQMGEDLVALIEEYRLLIESDPEKTESYYSNKSDHQTTAYDVDYDINIHNANPILSIFLPEFYLSPETRLVGNFRNGPTSILNLYTTFDEFRYKEISLSDNLLTINSSKDSDSPNVLSNVYLTSKKQHWTPLALSEKLIFDGTWSDDKIDFFTRIKQQDKSNKAVLHGELTFLDKKVDVQLDNSEVTLIKKEWKVQDDNHIVIATDRFEFANVAISKGDERIQFDGVISANPMDSAQLNIENFELNNLSTLLNISTEGSFSGTVDMQDMVKSPRYSSDMEIKNLTVLDNLIGDVGGKWKYAQQDEKIILDANIEREEIPILRLRGYYDTKDQAKPLHFNAKIKDAEFALLEPFMYGNATHLEGNINGSINIKGALESPDFNGKAKVSKGGFTIDYLNTHYRFNDVVTFKDDWIGVKNLTLTDTLFRSKGVLSGGFTHNLFKDYLIDATLDMNKTLALNTTLVDNDLFYGTAFGTGQVVIEGPINDLKIHSDEMRSEQGTKIYIPLEGESAITEKSYIKFGKIGEEKPKQVDLKENVSVSGVTMDFNFDVTPAAYFEIIFDERAEDKIKGRGLGQVNLHVDTRGDFSVFGDYEITEGLYNFTLSSLLIHKDFEIQPDSRVVWTGDPYGGKMSIKARKRFRTKLTPIASFSGDTTEERLALYNKNALVDAFLLLNGDLLAPEISFDIDITEYPPTLESQVSAFLSQLENSDQELNKQIFSLMVLSQLSPPESFGNWGTGSVSSVSELLSNQLGIWLSQIDENIEVDIDLSSFDPDQLNNVNIGVKWNKGPLSIGVNSTLTNAENQNDLANSFGEWTIEYALTDDGKLKLKAYNKTVQNQLSSSAAGTVGSNTTVYGFSLTHTESFNSFKELWRRWFKKPEEDQDETN